MRMLRAEFGYFLGAVQFLTRLPIPHLDGFAPEWRDRGVKYFPLAGLLVGAICAAVLLAASTLWTGVMPALLAVAAGIAATGAFHEDGFGDFFDAMGGATTESRLAIMKDSRLGAFGVLALGIGVALKVFALASVPPIAGAAALIGAHAGGRLSAIGAMRFLPYAGTMSTAKAKPLATNITAFGLAIGACFGLLPALLLPVSAALTATLAGFAAAFFMAWRAKCLLGGFTGDVLGAIEQSYEIAFLVAASACV
jgi:adenosylcobinamide-GDP ribazoletransferase